MRDRTPSSAATRFPTYTALGAIDKAVVQRGFRQDTQVDRIKHTQPERGSRCLR